MAAVDVMFSPKNKTPIATPKMIREYLKGVIADTSPIRIAEMIELYPIVPRKTPRSRLSQELASGQINGSLKKKLKARPDRAIDIKPCTPRV
jgi:hypothetical protein